MECLIGSKEDFLDFVNSISSQDRVAILTHNDLDGLASAVFLEKILEKKGVKPCVVEFLSCRDGMLDKVTSKLLVEKINKIFISDLAVDSIDFSGFEDLRNNFEVFLIDHHPVSERLQNFDKVIKTSSDNCSAVTLFRLGKELLDLKEWEWLVCAAIFSDVSYKNKENFELVKSVYPDFPEDESTMSTSTPGINARKIATALIYFDRDVRHVYDLILDKNISELEHAFQVVEEEIDYWVKDFADNAEFYSNRNLYWYYFTPKFGITSIVVTLVSRMKPDFSFVGISGTGEFLKISARNQNQTEDMNQLMKRGVEKLENASGGGHVPAAAARIQKKDLERFKENILNI